ncbi:hypothetical protein [Caenimonas sp. SL110]|uniref:hypothetical protein n=1 Tax=Caenimonas sp. SL110 TaxID=1450524 RepID=UPI000654339C|nr:hypothetical protein [Caenimonas sp. SL110]
MRIPGFSGSVRAPAAISTGGAAPAGVPIARKSNVTGTEAPLKPRLTSRTVAARTAPKLENLESKTCAIDPPLANRHSPAQPEASPSKSQAGQFHPSVEPHHVPPAVVAAQLAAKPTSSPELQEQIHHDMEARIQNMDHKALAKFADESPALRLESLKRTTAAIEKRAHQLTRESMSKASLAGENGSAADVSAAIDEARGLCRAVVRFTNRGKQMTSSELDGAATDKLRDAARETKFSWNTLGRKFNGKDAVIQGTKAILVNRETSLSRAFSDHLALSVTKRQEATNVRLAHKLFSEANAAQVQHRRDTAVEADRKARDREAAQKPTLKSGNRK